MCVDIHIFYLQDVTVRRCAIDRLTDIMKMRECQQRRVVTSTFHHPEHIRDIAL